MFVASMMITVALISSAPPEYKPPKDQVQFAQCVAKRESGHSPYAVSRYGTYKGKYQFNDALADGSTWMMLDWIETWHPKPRKYAEYLRALPMNKWPEQVQDAAFFETLNYNSKWSGKDHWAGGNWNC